MRILLTGTSSFTGYWFASALAKAGHHVVATFRGDPVSYSEVRGRRVAALRQRIECAWRTEFGDSRFLDLIDAGDWDLLCHHAAEMTNYRSPDFDALAASGSNTRNIREVLSRLARRGCGRLVLTGSVFEPFEGVGDLEQRSFSPYGLSKHFSYEIVRLEAHRLGLGLGKFVIPNPFGPCEEPRFTSYLVREWSAGRTPSVTTPVYIRDNIHVGLLAAEYVAFCESPLHQAGSKAVPSGYIEAQGAFAQRCARELGTRLGRPLAVELAHQTEFPEPLIRANASLAAPRHPEWSEAVAWDELYAYYAETFGLRNTT